CPSLSTLFPYTTLFRSVVEPGLGEVLAEVVWDKRLRAVASTEIGIRESDLALVCVGTPSRSNGRLDISAVERVAREIGTALATRSEEHTSELQSLRHLV